MSTSGDLPRVNGHRDWIPRPHPRRLHGRPRAQVLAIDVDEEKIAKAAAGEAPFFEPGPGAAAAQEHGMPGRLRFTTSFAEIGGVR